MVIEINNVSLTVGEFQGVYSGKCKREAVELTNKDN